jgi:hypothetical protein
MLVGEDLAQRAFVGVGHGAVGEQEVVVGVLRVAGAGGQRPAVLVRRVVADEIEHQADAGAAQFLGQGAQVFHAAQARVHGAVVADRIAAVVVAFRRAEQRHQVQVGQAQFLEVGNLGAQLLQVAGKEVDVADAAQHLLRLEPGGGGLTHGVLRLEVGGAVEPGLRGQRQRAFQVVEEVVLVAVQLAQEMEEAREVLVEPAAEGVPGGRAGVRGEFLLQPGQQPRQAALGVPILRGCDRHLQGPPV